VRTDGGDFTGDVGHFAHREFGNIDRPGRNTSQGCCASTCTTAARPV
jgi:hypothetical protein